MKKLSFLIAIGVFAVCAMSMAEEATSGGIQWCELNTVESGITTMSGPCATWDSACCSAYAQGVEQECFYNQVSQLPGICTDFVTWYCIDSAWGRCWPSSDPSCLYLAAQYCIWDSGPIYQSCINTMTQDAGFYCSTVASEVYNSCLYGASY